MTMATMGLSKQRLQHVERFDSHAALIEVLLLLRETIANPRIMSDLATAKIDAMRLTEDEEKKRLEAMALIARTDEIKNSFGALDARESRIDQQHKENLSKIEAMKTEARQGFEIRERALKESEDQLRKKHSSADIVVKTSEDSAKRTEDELRKKADDLAKKDEYLKGWERDLEKRLHEVGEREKALFGR